MAPASKSYLQTLVSKLHPQLPLDPRQSRQLLSILKTSFQNQLDLAHPPVEPSEISDVHSRYSKSSTLPSDRTPSTVGSSITPQAHTARHLESILSNPLLATRPDPSSFIFGGRAVHGAKQQNKDVSTPFSSASKTQQSFMWHVACGDAHLRTAKTYLQAIQSLRLSQPALPAHPHGNSHIRVESCEDILQWLFSSGVKTNMAVLSNYEFCAIIARSFVEEQNTVGVSRLLKHFLSFADTHRTHDLKDMWPRVLMSEWISSNFNTDREIGAIVHAFLEIVHDYRAHLPASKSSLVQFIFGQAANRLTKTLASNNQRMHVSMYDAFLHSLEQWSAEISVAKSILRLYHPEKPDVTALIALLKLPKTVESLKRASNGKREAIFRICLDAGQLLLSQEDHTRLSWILDFTSCNFADQVGTALEKTSVTRKLRHHIEGGIVRRTSRKRNGEELQDMGIFAVG